MTESTGNSNAVMNLDGAQNDVPHLHSVYLQPHTPQPGYVAPKGGSSLRRQSASFPFTLDGKVICNFFSLILGVIIKMHVVFCISSHSQDVICCTQQ